MNSRENYLRNARFLTPEYIPVGVHINHSMVPVYGAELGKVVDRYPGLFPGGLRNLKTADAYEDKPFFDTSRTNLDAWGCLWGYPVEGMDGIVLEHPLADWADFGQYRFPNPEKEDDRSPRDWQTEAVRIAYAHQNGQLATGSLAHGFMLLRLTYLRGFENALYDLMDDQPMMASLIAGIEKHSSYIVDKYMSMDVDLMEFPEDLGTQTSLIVSPQIMRKWVLPTYKRLMAPVKAAGKLIAFHSDGYTMEVLDDLIAVGVNIINPQDLVNGVDELKRAYKGRVCIRLDVDRQKIIPFGTPQEVTELIEYEVRTLGSKEGGLEMIVGVYPPTPLENLDALCAALTKYQRWWWQ